MCAYIILVNVFIKLSNDKCELKIKNGEQVAFRSVHIPNSQLKLFSDFSNTPEVFHRRLINFVEEENYMAKK